MAPWALFMFGLVFILILTGFPVAFTLGGISLLFGLVLLGPDFFQFMPSRVMGVMNNYVLISVPLFIFMGLVMERSGLAERLLLSMARLMGKRKGGLAFSVVIVGTLLAASTGVVGATVVTMGLISLPLMLRKGYSPTISAGTIAASGTLGQIIPPSVVLVLLGSVMNVPVGKLFTAAMIPGLILVSSYLVFLFFWFNLGREKIRPTTDEIEEVGIQTGWLSFLKTLILPILLISAVLGSIIAGIASPTEASAIGAAGAILLSFVSQSLKLDMLKQAMQETMYLTAMVFFILLGASTFSLVFRGLEGDVYLMDLLRNSQMNANGFLFLIMLVVFLLGFFIDFIEIIFIIVPIITPLLSMYGIDLLWIGVLLALNLQTSFLTPPFGFSLFYLKGVAPPEVSTRHIYRGIVPFIALQIMVVILVYLFPGLLYAG